MQAITSSKTVWRPLESVIKTPKCQNFMFIGCITVGKLGLFLYKHRNTRRYLNLDCAGNAYKFVKGKYLPIKIADALEHAYS